MMTTKILFKPALNHLLKPAVQRYLTQERLYTYKGIRTIVSPGVFHPGLFFSTKVMLKFLRKIDLSCKNVLDVGSGSGMISIAAAKQNAAVTAVDISTKAVRNTTENAMLNSVVVKAIQSDLFENLLPDFYEIVIVNPPFFLGEAENIDEQAWYCGNNAEFFQRFFTGIKKFTNSSSKIYMVLSDEAPHKKIMEMASEAGFTAVEVFRKSNLWETNYVWEFQAKPKV